MKRLAVLVGVAVVAGGSWLWAQGGPQPAFGQLLASPPNFVINTPTTITFTIRIDTPTLNPTTVELQRVDAQGNLLARVSRMYDNGQSGDAKPGDRTFTAVVALNEAQSGQVYFRVASAFRGNRQNAQSELLSIDVWGRVVVNVFTTLYPPNWEALQTDTGLELYSPSSSEAVARGDLVVPADMTIVVLSKSRDQTLQAFIQNYRGGVFLNYFESSVRIISGQSAQLYDDSANPVSSIPELAAFIPITLDEVVLVLSAASNRQNFLTVVDSIH